MSLSNTFLSDVIVPKVATSRPSSDTDNETDRLLGHQRNDQLNKLNSNNTISSNNTTDLQAVSNAIKQNANSREGKSF